MPPHSASALLQALGQSNPTSFDATFLQQQEEGNINKPATTHRLNVKTHVFKKELQEYVPTQIEDRLRIETIIYVELSIVDHNNALVNAYDYARLPKDLFFSQPDKVMSPQEMTTKRIVDVAATLQCPSNGWQEEKEACLRCARRMSGKLDQAESRIMHMLPELHRTENGDALISFRSGVANIQFKINCYCGHKKEKEGFVIRFDSKSDTTIASHVTLPLMFYHQNKNRIASRAAKAQAKSGQEQQQQQSVQGTAATTTTRNIVKNVSSKSKRDARSKPGHSPIGQQRSRQMIPSPPNSLLGSPIEWSSSPEMDDFMDSSDIPFTVPSPPPPDPLISLFPDTVFQDQRTQQQQQQLTIALISHMTPNSGPVRGGTMVTIHGTGFTVGEIMYVCFGENLVPIIPQRDHMLECITPAAIKADNVPVFCMNAAAESTSAAQATFTYVDDNEKELIKLALQRMMNISARMEGPLDSVLSRASEFTMWNDLLEGVGHDNAASSVNENSFSNAEKMVLESFKLLDSSATGQLNNEGLSIVNSTGHTMLHLAVALQYEALVKDLVLRGIDVTVQDKNGLSALNWARHMNNQAMVEVLSGAPIMTLSGPAGKVASDSASAVTSGLAMDVTLVEGGNVVPATKSDEVARGIQLLVSPGSQPSATDQPCVDIGHGCITQSTIHQSVPPQIATSDRFLCAPNSHINPQMDFEWEGFGQGPGKAVVAPVADVAVLERQHEVSFLLQQAQERTPATAVETGSTLDDGHQQDQYGRNLSAIPSTTADSDAARLMVIPHTPQKQLPVPGTATMDQAGIELPDVHRKGARILNLAPVHCPIGRHKESPVGDLGHIAPVVQDVVTAEGCTSGPTDDMSPCVPGICKHDQEVGEVHIHNDSSPLDVSNGVVVSGVVAEMSEIPCLVGQSSEVVVSADVVLLDNDEGGSLNSATKQAVVQSSRNDVESEPSLFLGGLPVALSPRPTHIQRTTASNHDDAGNRAVDNQGSVARRSTSTAASVAAVSATRSGTEENEKEDVDNARRTGASDEASSSHSQPETEQDVAPNPPTNVDDIIDWDWSVCHAKTAPTAAATATTHDSSGVGEPEDFVHSQGRDGCSDDDIGSDKPDDGPSEDAEMDADDRREEPPRTKLISTVAEKTKGHPYFRPSPALASSSNAVANIQNVFVKLSLSSQHLGICIEESSSEAPLPVMVPQAIMPSVSLPMSPTQIPQTPAIINPYFESVMPMFRNELQDLRDQWRVIAQEEISGALRTLQENLESAAPASAS
ncbi:SPT3 Dosage dependent suppressor of Ty-induced promoter mutations-like protein, partial [Mortierella polycephala]